MANHLASGLRIRAMTAEDIPAGLRLCRAAGWNQLEGDWHLFVGSEQGWAFAAEKDDQVVGTGAVISYGALSWIAMMLVDPQERRSGLGSQLMAELLTSLDGADCVGLDATPMAEALYRRYGFVKDYGVVRMQATVQAARVGKPSGRARRMTVADLDNLMAHDRGVFGADRGPLLASLLKRAPECAWIVKDAPLIHGYCLGRPGHHYQQLGPLVAGDRDTARELVAHCLTNFDGKAVAIDVPRLDGEWLAWLESVGFLEVRSFVRMFRRGPRCTETPGLPALQYAIAGPEFA